MSDKAPQPFTPEQRRALARLCEQFAQHGVTLAGLLEQRSDSYEQQLAATDLAALERFWSLLFTPGLSLEEALEQAPPWPRGTRQAGRAISAATLSGIKSGWAIKEALDSVGQTHKVLQQVREKAKGLPVEGQEELVEAVITLLGDEVLKDKLSGQKRLSENLKPVDRLLKRSHAKAKGRLEERKLAVAERRLALLEKREGEARDALADPALSEQERTARMRQIFGMS